MMNFPLLYSFDVQITSETEILYSTVVVKSQRPEEDPIFACMDTFIRRSRTIEELGNADYWHDFLSLLEGNRAKNKRGVILTDRTDFPHTLAFPLPTMLEEEDNNPRAYIYTEGWPDWENDWEVRHWYTTLEEAQDYVDDIGAGASYFMIVNEHGMYFVVYTG